MQHSRTIFRADSFDNEQEGKSGRVVRMTCFNLFSLSQKKSYQLPRDLEFELQEIAIRRNPVTITCHSYMQRDILQPFCAYTCTHHYSSV